MDDDDDGADLKADADGYEYCDLLILLVAARSAPEGLLLLLLFVFFQRGRRKQD